MLSKFGEIVTLCSGTAVKLLHADLNKDGSVSMEEYKQFSDCKLDEGGQCVSKVYQAM